MGPRRGCRLFLVHDGLIRRPRPHRRQRQHGRVFDPLAEQRAVVTVAL